MVDRQWSSDDGIGLGPVDFADVRDHRSRFVAVGIALIVLGALAIFLPLVAGLVTTLLLGWLLVLGGIVEGIHGFSNRRWGGSGWAIVSALVYVVAGALVIAFPVRSKLMLTLILAGFLVADGVLKILRALQHRALPSWGWLLFDGILALVLGLLLWLHWPSTAAWAIGLLVGVDLVSNGASMLLIGLGAGQVARARP